MVHPPYTPIIAVGTYKVVHAIVFMHLVRLASLVTYIGIPKHDDGALLCSNAMSSSKQYVDSLDHAVCTFHDRQTREVIPILCLISALQQH